MLRNEIERNTKNVYEVKKDPYVQRRFLTLSHLLKSPLSCSFFNIEFRMFLSLCVNFLSFLSTLSSPIALVGFVTLLAFTCDENMLQWYFWLTFFTVQNCTHKKRPPKGCCRRLHVVVFFFTGMQATEHKNYCSFQIMGKRLLLKVVLLQKLRGLILARAVKKFQMKGNFLLWLLNQQERLNDHQVVIVMHVSWPEEVMTIS